MLKVTHAYVVEDKEAECGCPFHIHICNKWRNHVSGPYHVPNAGGYSDRETAIESAKSVIGREFAEINLVSAVTYSGMVTIWGNDM